MGSGGNGGRGGSFFCFSVLRCFEPRCLDPDPCAPELEPDVEVVGPGRILKKRFFSGSHRWPGISNGASAMATTTSQRPFARVCQSSRL